MNVEGQLAFRIVEQTTTRVLGEMPVQAGLRNPFGTVHAGAMIWFADVCATVLAMGSTEAHPGMKGFPLAISLNAHLVGNQTDGTLTAESTFVKQGRSVSVIRTLVRGEGGKLLADLTTSHVLSK